MRAWSSLVSLWLIPDILAILPSSCLPSLNQSRVCCLLAWGNLADIERLLYPLELLCWLTYTEALSCSIEHVINILRVWHVPKMLSQLTLPRHRCLATWQPLTEPSQPRKMGATFCPLKSMSRIPEERETFDIPRWSLLGNWTRILWDRLRRVVLPRVVRCTRVERLFTSLLH